MTHTEQITVYRYQKANDGYGGFTPATPTLMTLAPTWATFKQVSGDDYIIGERFATANRYSIFVNQRDDFTWARNMFIVSDRYGAIDIEGIKEDKRVRTMTLDGIYIEGVDDTGSGTPGSVGGLNVLYYTVPADASTITLPALDGATTYLFFRSGVEKTIVSSGPLVDQVAINGAVVSLVAGDIFYQDERITVLYQ